MWQATLKIFHVLCLVNSTTDVLETPKNYSSSSSSSMWSVAELIGGKMHWKKDHYGNLFLVFVLLPIFIFSADELHNHAGLYKVIIRTRVPNLDWLGRDLEELAVTDRKNIVSFRQMTNIHLVNWNWPLYDK